MEAEPDAVVGHAVLGVVVGPDLLAALGRADLLPALLRDGLSLLALGALQQVGAENAHRLLAVLELRPLILAGHDDARGEVLDAHSGLDLVDVLAAGAARAVGPDLEFIRAALDVHLFRLGQDGHRPGGSVDPPGRFCHRHPPNPVDPALVLQAAVRALSGDPEDDLLEAANPGRA